MNEPGENRSTEHREIIEPEIIPPDDRPSSRADSGWTSFRQAFGPMVGGILMDIVDFATFGPVGVVYGMVVGGAIAFWIARIFEQPLLKRIFWGCVGALYCMLPILNFIPMASLVAAFICFNHKEKRRENRYG